MLQLLEHMPAAHALTPSSVLVDVGSGVGKLVLAAAVLSPVALAVGLEIEPQRAEIATSALAAATRLGLLRAPEAERVRLLHADATRHAGTAAGALLGRATHVCAFSNACAALTDARMRAMSLRLGPGVRRQPMLPRRDQRGCHARACGGSPCAALRCRTATAAARNGMARPSV